MKRPYHGTSSPSYRGFESSLAATTTAAATTAILAAFSYYLYQRALSSSVAWKTRTWPLTKWRQQQEHAVQSSQSINIDQQENADKVVLIACCGSDFRNLLTHSAVKAGFAVVTTCYTEEGAAELVESLRNNVLTSGKSALTVVVANLQTPEGRQEVVHATKKACTNFGGLYAVVNDSGINIPGNIDWADPQTFESLMKVNFLAPVELTYELLPLIKKKRGRVINLTSVDGIVPLPGVGAYAASKAALESFSDVLRCEMLDWGVKVVVIEPSTMRTALAMNFADDFHKTFDEAPEDRQMQYGPEWMKSVHAKLSQDLNETALDPNDVVQDILKALLLKDPPTRILSGHAAKLFYKPISLLPDKMRDYILYYYSSKQSRPAPLGIALQVPPPGKIAFIEVGVSDLEQSVSFYEQLGFSQVHDRLNGQQFMAGGKQSLWKPLLLLKENPALKPRSGRSHVFGMTQLALFTNDLDQELERLSLLGISPLYPPSREKMFRVASIVDPDGFVIYYTQITGLIGLVARANSYLHSGHMAGPTPLYCNINVRNAAKVKNALQALDFHIVTEQNREQVYNHLLPAIGLKGYPETIIEHTIAATLAGDQFRLQMMQWTSPMSVSTGHEFCDSLVVTVSNVEAAWSKAHEAGITMESQISQRSLPFYGEVKVASGYLEEGANRIEFVSFF